MQNSLSSLSSQSSHDETTQDLAAQIENPNQLTMAALFPAGAFGATDAFDATNPVGLASSENEDEVSYANVATCPDCGAGMIRYGFCVSCPSCGLEGCGA